MFLHTGDKMEFNINKKGGVKVINIFKDKEYSNDLYKYVKDKGLFNGELASSYSYLPYNGEKEILLGFGLESELSVDDYRYIYFNLAKELIKNKEEEATINIEDVAHLELKDIIKATVEGLLQALYKFDKYKSDKKSSPKIVININTDKDIEEYVNEAKQIVESIFLARDIVNERAEYLYPETLANIVVEKLSPLGVEVEVYDEKQCEQLGLKAFLSVARGSERKPRFIVMKYLNNPSSEEVIGFVGKGVTYDTGGYSLKPSTSMETMFSDMGGAGSTIGAMHLIASRKVKTNVIAVVAACENNVSGSAYKPGDVISSLSGKTIEVINTDAEGRITLADAVYYATEKLKVSKVIDLATLTGACLVALAEYYTGALTNNEEFFNEFKKAADDSGERVWRMPADDSFRSLNKSKVADLKNTGGRLGGTITAGLFIENFVANNTPWIHLDIAGTAYLSQPEKYRPFGATGVHVKALYNLVNKK